MISLQIIKKWRYEQWSSKAFWRKSQIKKELEELRLRVATSRPQDNKNFSSNNSSSASNNVDILKRISNLEKAVFGK